MFIVKKKRFFINITFWSIFLKIYMRRVRNIKINVSLYLREQVNFKWDDDEVHFVLDQHAELDFYSASSLIQQSVCRHVAPLGHIILIPNQPVFNLTP